MDCLRFRETRYFHRNRPCHGIVESFRCAGHRHSCKHKDFMIRLPNPLRLSSKLPFGRRTLWKILVRLFPIPMRDIPHKVNGIKMHLDLSQILDREYAQGLYDREELRFLLSSYEKDSYFVDIGANQGFYSLNFAKEKPEARILAVEPDPYSLDKLQKNISTNNFKNIIICPYAISDSEEPKDLLINTANNRAGSGVVLSQIPWTKNKTEVIIRVPCKTLLNVLISNNVNKISALKIDIEGYEYPVLRKFFADAPKSLYPKAIVVEAFGYMINLVGGSPIEILLKHGYRLINHSVFNYHFEFDSPL